MSERNYPVTAINGNLQDHPSSDTQFIVRASAYEE